MKKRIIPLVALTALMTFGAVATTLTSCGDNAEKTEVKVIVTSTNKAVKVGSEITLETRVEGTSETSVTWAIAEPNNNVVEVVDAKAGKFKGIAEGSQKVRVSLDADPSKTAVVTILVTPKDAADPDTVISIKKITETKDELLSLCSIQGTIVALYDDKDNQVSAMVYDGTGYINLYCFAKKSDNKFAIGDVVKVKGTPNRRKEYYWAAFSGIDDKTLSITKVADGKPNALPEIKKWTHEDAKKYDEKTNCDGQYIEVIVETYKSGNYTNFRVVTGNNGNTEEEKNARAITLSFTDTNASYATPGAKVKFTGITGDLKNSETLIQLYPISYELVGLSLTAEKDTIRVGETTQLTLKDGETSVTEGVTFTSKNEDIATVDATGKVKAIKEGEATIEAKRGEEVVSIKITVEVANENYDSEVTVATCKEITEATLDKKKLYKVTGTIAETTKYSKNGEFYLKDDSNKDAEKGLWVYNSAYGQNCLGKNSQGEWTYSSKDGEGTTLDFIKVGNKVTLYVFRADYNNQIEVKGAIVECLDAENHDARVLPHAGEALEAENDATKLFEFDGTVKEVQNINFGQIVVEDSKGNDVVIYNSSTNKTAIKQNVESKKWSFDSESITTPENLIVGAKIKFLGFRADYNGKKQFKGLILDCETEKIETINIDTTKKTIHVEETTNITTSLTPSGAYGKLVWKSSDDTIATVENGTVKGVKAGKAKIFVETTVDETLIKSNEIEIEVIEDTTVLATEFDLDSLPMPPKPEKDPVTDKTPNDPVTTSLTVENALETINKTLVGEKNIVTGITKIEKVYPGNRSSGPGEKQGLKFSTGSTNGTITFTTSEDVYKVEVAGFVWGDKNSYTFNVNEDSSTLLTADKNTEFKTPIYLGTGSKTITLTISARFVMTNLKLYTQKAA